MDPDPLELEVVLGEVAEEDDEALLLLLLLALLPVEEEEATLALLDLQVAAFLLEFVSFFNKKVD